MTDFSLGKTDNARDGAAHATRARGKQSRRTEMPLRLQKKATRVVRAVVEEVNVARGVGTRTDKRGNAKTSLWDHGKVRACVRSFGLNVFFVLALRLTRGIRLVDATRKARVCV